MQNHHHQKFLDPSEDKINLIGLILICGGITNGVLSLKSSIQLKHSYEILCYS